MRANGWAMLLAATGAAFALGAILARQRDGFGAPPGTDCNRVRDAGPEEMRDPPRTWDRVDEFVDESFPASDPPGNY
ncbi:hypothetical protein [Citreimonas salinaria]|nr:hypothetical protein [Citreimonas salinaria]